METKKERIEREEEEYKSIQKDRAASEAKKERASDIITIYKGVRNIELEFSLNNLVIISEALNYYLDQIRVKVASDGSGMDKYDAAEEALNVIRSADITKVIEVQPYRMDALIEVIAKGEKPEIRMLTYNDSLPF